MGALHNEHLDMEMNICIDLIGDRNMVEQCIFIELRFLIIGDKYREQIPKAAP